MSESFLQTTLKSVLPAYLYNEYSDDDAVRAFFDAFNTMVQQYVDSFNQINLPIYTEDQIQSALLDWVGTNLYNQVRPVLTLSLVYEDGPFGTSYFGDFLPLGEIEVISITSYDRVLDDMYKRIITWNFYRGDGPYFNTRWLKRRVQRFLTGVAGTAPDIDQTYDISVSFVGNQVDINIAGLIVIMVTGDIFGLEEFGTGIAFGSIDATVTSQDVPPLAVALQEAVANGVLLLPFQKTFVVNLPE